MLGGKSLEVKDMRSFGLGRKLLGGNAPHPFDQ